MGKGRLGAFMVFLSLVAGCGARDGTGILVPPTADQDPRIPSVNLRIAGHTRKVHVRTYGDPSRPPLFVLHGSYTDSRALHVLRDLADKYYVVVWDQRGVGLSERITAAEFSFDTCVEEIEALRSHFASGRKISLLGHSWGGGIASLYAGRHPEVVEDLVLFEPIPLNDKAMAKVYESIMDFDYLNSMWSRMGWSLESYPPRDHASLDFRARQVLDSGMTRYFCDPEKPPAWPIWRVGGYVELLRNNALADAWGNFHYDFSRGLKDFPGRTLLVGGSCGALGHGVQVAHTAPLLNNPRVEKVEGAGHRFVIEKRERTLEILRSFLRAYEE